jgi:hypothetical protein
LPIRAAAPANIECCIRIIPPELLKSIAQCGNEALRFRIALTKHHQHADPSHLASLLRARRERPRRRAAEQRDDLASM